MATKQIQIEADMQPVCSYSTDVNIDHGITEEIKPQPWKAA